MVFTTWASSVAGPTDDIELVGDECDVEVELVLVVVSTADRVAPGEVVDSTVGGIGAMRNAAPRQPGDPVCWPPP